MADHPITTPPELVEQWRAASSNVPASLSTDSGGRRDYIDYIATQAARWGADQELEACCEWVGDGRRENLSQVIALRAARRPKPPSLAEEALKGPSDEELAECYRKAYYAHKDRQGPAAQVAALRAVLAKWGRQ